MKKNLKKLLLLLMAMLMMLALIACGAEDDDDDDDDDDKEDKKKSESTASPEDLIEKFMDAFKEFDVDKMNKYALEGVLDEETAEMYEEWEGGEAEYEEDGIYMKVDINIDYDLGDVEEIDIEDLEEAMEDEEDIDIDFDKVESVYECEITLEMEMKVKDIEIDYDELGITEEEAEEYYGMPLEDYFTEDMEGTEEDEGTFYVGEYDGEWLLLFADGM